ncbi:phosphatidate cytidylyltransferase [Xanthobacteraceae bacterium Astr-EGSB]|uniref:phosphatidate cytidylyltransferase n=1 Tax=Astrobacterium formosum TaxID=3069710 RepID=UPI0027B8155D|nr:phosphatidate cytidylyltransferase [Xanthobacteraceae bacterium Astr-EGSB]
MTDSDRAPGTKPGGAPALKGGEFVLRVASAAVLAPLALVLAYWGGWAFVVFWAAAAIAVHCEWTHMVADRRAPVLATAGGILIAVSAVTVVIAGLGAALVLLAATVLALAFATAPERRLWTALGVAYAGAVLMAPLVLRQDRDHGFAVIVLLFAVVWATDIGGYFAGRLIGGAKLWPRVSPKKTWAGALGGSGAAVASAIAVAGFVTQANPLAVAILALLLSAVSQAGDLFESAVKRRFGVKDAGRIIPGHGGVMDRLDGFVAAALIAALIGIVRGGADAAGHGLLLW